MSPWENILILGSLSGFDVATFLLQSHTFRLNAGKELFWGNFLISVSPTDPPRLFSNIPEYKARKDGFRLQEAKIQMNARKNVLMVSAL